MAAVGSRFSRVVVLGSSFRGCGGLALRAFSTSGQRDSKHYPVVVVGGGTGGCSVAARLCRKLGKGNVAVVEPAEYHYYQPMWTLVGAGVKTLDDSQRLMSSLLPKSCDWHRNKVDQFDPKGNRITLDNGEELSYDYLVIALGIQINEGKVDGLVEALKEDPRVCTNYLPQYVTKTFPALQQFKGGNAIFTFPNTPIKCAGAPQKIMYLADEFWRKQGVRDQSEILFNTSLGVIFGVKKYAASLMKVVQKKNIKLNLKRNLVAVDHHKSEATFEDLDSETGEKETYKYDFLHVSPPMSAPDVLKNSTVPIVDPASGFLSVNKNNLQHTTYSNIFGLGDCTNVPTAKTAAACAAQNKIVCKSIDAVMSGRKPTGQYDGYTSCPLITGYSKCILAEFDFDGQPMETFPIDQSKERRTMYHMKKDVMPQIYWTLMMNGRWNGPKLFRKAMHLGMSR